MKIKCRYCDSYMDEELSACPNCGAANADIKRTAEGVPATIEELKAYCEARKMPLEKMRFFIGQDYKGPRAFGIYRDDSGYEPVFIVYKNKSDGQRAVRYSGTDEAYAVNEIYQKIREETLKQAAAGNIAPKGEKPSNLHYGNKDQSYDWNKGDARPRSPQKKPRKGLDIFTTVVVVIIIAINISTVTSSLFHSIPFNRLANLLNIGRYYYIDDSYYYQTGTSKWYEYIPDDDDWSRIEESDIPANYGDYESSYDAFTDDYGETSTYGYSEPGSSSWDSDSGSSWDDDWDSGWDSDTDWDYGGWDSDYSDWDSDW